MTAEIPVHPCEMGLGGLSNTPNTAGLSEYGHLSCASSGTPTRGSQASQPAALAPRQNRLRRYRGSLPWLGTPPAPASGTAGALLPWGRKAEAVVSNTQDHAGAPQHAGCPTHLYMSIRDRPENCHWQGKPPGPPESPVWVVTAATECRCYPKFWSPSLLVSATARSRREQTRRSFKKEKNYLVSSLSLPPLKCPTFSPLSSPPLFSWEPGFLSSAWNQSSDFLAVQRDSNES